MVRTQQTVIDDGNTNEGETPRIWNNPTTRCPRTAETIARNLLQFTLTCDDNALALFPMHHIHLNIDRKEKPQNSKQVVFLDTERMC